MRVEVYGAFSGLSSLELGPHKPPKNASNVFSGFTRRTSATPSLGALGGPRSGACPVAPPEGALNLDLGRFKNRRVGVLGCLSFFLLTWALVERVAIAAERGARGRRPRGLPRARAAARAARFVVTDRPRWLRT